VRESVEGVEMTPQDIARAATEKVEARIDAGFRLDVPTAEITRSVEAIIEAACLSAVESFAKYLQHEDNCEKRPRGFHFKSNGCKRCHGTGCIPSETCEDCPDCQETCPECKGRVPEYSCTCGLDAQLAAFREKEGGR
jgi:excinuclease UvrABC ATPase subunit